MRKSYSKIRHIQESNIILEQRKFGLLNEQSTPLTDEKIIDYVCKQWGISKGFDEGVEVNSGGVFIKNFKTNSEIKVLRSDNKIYYDKSFSVDPKPIPTTSTFEEFKKWFDSNNNYNPLSGLMS